jgi:hypothetical protein
VLAGIGLPELARPLVGLAMAVGTPGETLAEAPRGDIDLTAGVRA